MIYYVYFLRNSLTKEIFYVGKGKGSRMYKHLVISKNLNNTRNPHLYNTIRKLYKDGGKIIYEKIIENISEFEAFENEKFHIKKIGTRHDVKGVNKRGTLLNLTAGGEGTSGFKLSEETKRKMSKSKTGVKRGPLSDITKKKLSESAKGKPGYWKDKKLPVSIKNKMSETKKGKEFNTKHKENLSKSLKGRTLSEEHKKAISEAHKGKVPWNKKK